MDSNVVDVPANEMSIKSWLGLKCFETINDLSDNQAPSTRSTIQNLFMRCTNLELLRLEIKKDLQRFLQVHCIRLSSTPADDILNVLLKSKHECVIGKNFEKIITEETHYEFYSKIHGFYLQPKIPHYIMKQNPGANFPPIIVVESKKLCYKSIASSSELEQNLPYRLFQMGDPWDRYALMKDSDLLKFNNVSVARYSFRIRF